MANDMMVLGGSGLPAHLQGRSFGVTQDLMQGMYTGGNRIGLKGSRFRLVVAGIEEGVFEENYLDVIILGAAPAVSRVYYDGAYKSGENQPPSCYSADGLVPAEDVKNKQADKCMLCKQNAKGSKIVDGQQFKACSYFRRVVVMLAGDTDKRMVYKLDVKSQGLFGEGTQNEKNLNDYIKMVNTRGADLGAIVTRIKFDVNSSVPKLLFGANRYITEDEADAVDSLVHSEEVISLKTVSMSTLDVSSEEPTSGDVPQEQVYEDEPAAAPAPAPAPQRQAAPQAQRPAQTATKPAAQQAQRPATQQPQRPAQAQAQQPVRQAAAQRPAAQQPQKTTAQRPVVQSNVPPPQQRQAAAPAPAPVEEVGSDDELADILAGLE